jgi:hypothetical protein
MQDLFGGGAPVSGQFIDKQMQSVRDAYQRYIVGEDVWRRVVWEMDKAAEAIEKRGNRITWSSIQRRVSQGLQQLGTDLENAIIDGATEGWDYITGTLWPTVRSTIEGWLDTLVPIVKRKFQNIVGAVLGSLDEQVQDMWMGLAKRMKRQKLKEWSKWGYTEEQMERYRNKPPSWYLPANKASAWEEGVLAEYEMLMKLQKIVGPLARLGAQMQAGADKGPGKFQNLSPAARRGMYRGGPAPEMPSTPATTPRQRRRQRQLKKRGYTTRAQRIWSQANETLGNILEDNKVEGREWMKLREVLQRLESTEGGVRGRLEQMREALTETLGTLIEDQRDAKRIIEDMRQDLRRLQTARQ